MTSGRLPALAAILGLLSLAACSSRADTAGRFGPEPRLADVPLDIPLAIATDSILPPGQPPLEIVEGDAVFYATRFNGRTTASGIIFSNDELFAAHRTWPFGTMVRVTNLLNQRAVIVRIVDRGPFGSSPAAPRRIIDLSQRAAAILDFIPRGHTPVRLEVLQWGG